MAKVNGPLMSESASGNFGKAMEFRRTLNGHVVTRQHRPGSVTPAQPSAAQLTQRTKYADAASQWQALTVSERLAYSDQAKPQKITGWNLYLSEQLSISSAGGQPPFGSIVDRNTALGAVTSMSLLFNGPSASITDSSGLGRHGNIVGAPEPTKVATDFGFALNNAKISTGYVQMADIPYAELASAFTLFIVARNPGGVVPTTTPQVLFSMGIQPSSTVTAYLSNGSELNFLIRGSGGNQTITTTSNISFGVNNDWHFLFFRWDGIALHIHTSSPFGTSYTTGTLSGNINQWPAGPVIGGDPAGYPWTGDINHVQLFNSSLSDPEIISLINDRYLTY